MIHQGGRDETKTGQFCMGNGKRVHKKGTNKGRIKAKSPEERVSKWKTHS